MAKRQTTRTVHPQKVPITKAVHGGGDGTWRDIVEEALEGVALCFILVLVAMLISKTGPGEQFALFSYRVLQGQLRALPAKVTVIDIGEIRPEITGDPTPRPKLKMILKAIAANGPAVIGIDIDFSPNVVGEKPAGYMESDDPSFSISAGSWDHEYSWGYLVRNFFLRMSGWEIQRRGTKAWLRLFGYLMTPVASLLPLLPPTLWLLKS